MSAASTNYQYLAPNPKSHYRSLFIKGTRLRARTIYGDFANEEDPMTPEEIAVDRKLPLEAVKEAIAYCESNPLEIEEDYRREEALAEAIGENDPNYKYHPRPKTVAPEDLHRILRG
jgi:uncharacterized protein (DUF433 family)